MSDNTTYNNWLVSLDSDNFSMFIKTWFAFLSSVRKLVLDQASDEERQTLETIHGDKTFLEKYNKNLSSMLVTPTMRANIFDAFLSSRAIVGVEYPEYYFQTYYKKIRSFNFCRKEVASVGKAQYKYDINVSAEAIHVGILAENKSVAAGLQVVYVQKKIPISNLARNINVIEDSGQFYSHIKSIIQERLLAQITPKLKQVARDRLQSSLSALSQIIINRARDNTSSKGLYENIFCLWCDSDNSTDADLKEWFLGFCYLLRNILFHRIIDPFDSRWSGVMKACYQGLREFLLANIDMLNEVKRHDGDLCADDNIQSDVLPSHEGGLLSI